MSAALAPQDRAAKDRADLDAALALIREHAPTAVTAGLETSDQQAGYGFVLLSVRDAEGREVDLPDAIDDRVSDLICDLNWDGVVGENRQGYATLDLPPAVPSAVPPVLHCPTGPTRTDGQPHTVIGCGSTNLAGPDDEGLYDCLDCGIFFDPTQEDDDTRGTRATATEPAPPLVNADGTSGCCNATLEITREVCDTLAYTAEDFEDGVLSVSFRKSFDGDGGDYSVSCTRCGKGIDVEVEER